MFANARSVIRKAFLFRGRASRSEFWMFVLFLLVTMIVLTVVNSLIFGPEQTVTFIVSIDGSGQQSQELRHMTSYTSGLLGNVFGLIILIPWLAVAWRRMHDIGRPGWMCLLPIAGLAVTFAVTFFSSESIPVDPSRIPEGVDLPNTVRVPGNAAVFIIGWLIGFGSIILTVVLLALGSNSGDNRYGTSPTRVL